MRQTAMKRHIEWLKCRVAISKELEETLLNEEKEQLEMFYCRTDKCHNNLIKNSAKLFYNKLFTTT